MEQSTYIQSTGKFSFFEFLHSNILKRTVLPQYNTHFCMHLLRFPLSIPVSVSSKGFGSQKTAQCCLTSEAGSTQTVPIPLVEMKCII